MSSSTSGLAPAPQPAALSLSNWLADRAGEARRLLRLGGSRGDFPGHAGDGRGHGRARRLHRTAREGIRLERSRHIGCARGAARALRSDRAVRGGLHQPLRRENGGDGGDAADRCRHPGLARHDRTLAARRPVGRDHRLRHRHGRAGARRDGRDPVVRQATRLRRWHADGELRRPGSSSFCRCWPN